MRAVIKKAGLEAAMVVGLVVFPLLSALQYNPESFRFFVFWVLFFLCLIFYVAIHIDIVSRALTFLSKPGTGPAVGAVIIGAVLLVRSPPPTTDPEAISVAQIIEVLYILIALYMAVLAGVFLWDMDVRTLGLYQIFIGAALLGGLAIFFLGPTTYPTEITILQILELTSGTVVLSILFLYPVDFGTKMARVRRLMITLGVLLLVVLEIFVLIARFAN